ncbi:hypothetical protein PPL_11454 [Heterostelium album PN500]|uniref:Uncharacterized protein n=1 Tax=Heterostelium pallidum (strain ATCC 26659 / Pp 5 / PN500) TaxID=670386 RepID=D3BTG0_HETP5|nr:hypothetical protein PPL_11454 [Heterostelium album PN500]EFA75377.1 hypothetical protein PPL_11454 [Heterostelium album PN500]|eukprot:XP_020427511.1 hypothetical protein PPL_11454 [Heterostelium album PN500]
MIYVLFISLQIDVFVVVLGIWSEKLLKILKFPKEIAAVISEFFDGSRFCDVGNIDGGGMLDSLCKLENIVRSGDAIGVEILEI